MLVSAVRVVSAPELVGVHARGGGKRFRALSQDAVRYANDGGGSEKRTLKNVAEGGRSFIPLESGLRNLFEFFSSFHHRTRLRSR